MPNFDYAIGSVLKGWDGTECGLVVGAIMENKRVVKLWQDTIKWLTARVAQVTADKVNAMKRGDTVLVNKLHSIINDLNSQIGEYTNTIRRYQDAPGS